MITCASARYSNGIGTSAPWALGSLPATVPVPLGLADVLRSRSSTEPELTPSVLGNTGAISGGLGPGPLNPNDSRSGPWSVHRPAQTAERSSTSTGPSRPNPRSIETALPRGAVPSFSLRARNQAPPAPCGPTKRLSRQGHRARPTSESIEFNRKAPEQARMGIWPQLGPLRPSRRAPRPTYRCIHCS